MLTPRSIRALRRAAMDGRRGLGSRSLSTRSRAGLAGRRSYVSAGPGGPEANHSDRDLYDVVDDAEVVHDEVLVEPVLPGRPHAGTGGHVVAAAVLWAGDEAALLQRQAAEPGPLMGAERLKGVETAVDVGDGHRPPVDLDCRRLARTDPVERRRVVELHLLPPLATLRGGNSNRVPVAVLLADPLPAGVVSALAVVPKRPRG